MKNRNTLLTFIICFFIVMLTSCAHQFNSNTSNDELVLSSDQARYVGNKVRFNETGGDQSAMIHWNVGEIHASVGIAHFIWYPVGVDAEFTESFPQFVLYLKHKGIELPRWLLQRKGCPWRNRKELMDAKINRTKEYVELEQLLDNSMSFQVEFLVHRLTQSLPLMLDSIRDESLKKTIQNQFQAIIYTSDNQLSIHGVYTLLDYVNFKGEGVNVNERYRGQGWGLLQVLENMSPQVENTLSEFVKSAKFVIDRRIQNSPSERNEERWRLGWFKRIDTYAEASY